MPLLDFLRRRPPSPTSTLGTPGAAVFGGYVVENEKNPALTGTEKYRQFSETLTNCSVAAAGVRYFLNLCAKADWSFNAAEHPEGERLAELAEAALTDDPRTSWSRIIRRAAMYRFYGFSIQEWTMEKHRDGHYTFEDVAPRAQVTIEKWDVDRVGKVLGVTQVNPQDGQEIYLPRGKLAYIVDDTINDSPFGLGLFRHIIDPAKRLKRYEQLEGLGFETDLRGTPIGRAPYAELSRAVADGVVQLEDAQRALKPIENFIKTHIKKADLGLLLDSEPFAAVDEAARPTTVRKFDLDLLRAQSSALPDMANAIERVNREIARVLGVEAILLGDGEHGSFALAKDKTNQFSLVVDATLEELADAFRTDLLGPLWKQNGWPVEAMPRISPQAAQYRDVEEITNALRDLAQAGSPVDLDDPVINDVRALLGVAKADLDNRNLLEQSLVPESRNDRLPGARGED